MDVVNLNDLLDTTRNGTQCRWEPGRQDLPVRYEGMVKMKNWPVVCMDLMAWIAEGATEEHVLHTRGSHCHGTSKRYSPVLGWCGKSEDALPFLSCKITKAWEKGVFLKNVPQLATGNTNR